MFHDRIKTGYDLLIVTGATASGKTSLAVAMAYNLGGEVISADSRQVYRRMDLGTGKDYNEYRFHGKTIPYHLIDIAEPGYKYNVFEFQRDFIKVYNDIKKRDLFPVVCGGSGMYIDSIISGYKMVEVPPDTGLRARLEKKSMEELRGILLTYKKLHNITDLDTKKRVIRAIEIEHASRIKTEKHGQFPYLKSLVVGVMYDRETRRDRISERLRQRIKSGMIEEVRQLLESGIGKEVLIYYGLEYKYITLFLNGVLTYNEMVEKLETAIHQFAKRQMTWFRGMEKKGIKVNWLPGEMPLGEKVRNIKQLLTDYQ